MAKRAKATYAMVALLRGINVGGKNKVPMAELREVFEGLGHEQVSTYIASGNVLFVGDGQCDEAARAAEKAIAKTFGCQVPVVVRTAEEVCRALEGVPYMGADPARAQIGFCASEPRGKVDPARSPQDEIRVVGKHVYMHSPRGIAQSKFTSAYLDKALGTTMTFRNVRTVGEIVGRLEGLFDEGATALELLACAAASETLAGRAQRRRGPKSRG